MEKRDLALSLLVLTVLASGCVDGNGQSTDQESTGSITIHSLDVQPQEIYDGDSVQVSLDLANTGNLQAEVDPGDQGKNILRDHCRDIFNISDNGFQSNPESLANGEVETLHPDEEAALRWTLQQTGNVPQLYDQKCHLKLQVPFSYEVAAYRQVQIKQDRSIEGTENLQSESSSGPLLFAIEAQRGTGAEGQDTFIAGEDETMRILLQIQNTEKTAYNKGVIDIDESSLEVSLRRPVSTGSAEFGVTAPLESNILDSHCDFDEDNELRMYEGQSRIISCEVPISDEVGAPSSLGEIRASVDYEYLKDAGSRTVEVSYDGG